MCLETNFLILRQRIFNNLMPFNPNRLNGIYPKKKIQKRLNKEIRLSYALFYKPLNATSFTKLEGKSPLNRGSKTNANLVPQLKDISYLLCFQRKLENCYHFRTKYFEFCNQQSLILFSISFANYTITFYYTVSHNKSETVILIICL